MKEAAKTYDGGGTSSRRRSRKYHGLGDRGPQVNLVHLDVVALSVDDHCEGLENFCISMSDREISRYPLKNQIKVHAFIADDNVGPRATGIGLLGKHSTLLRDFFELTFFRVSKLHKRPYLVPTAGAYMYKYT